MRLTVRSCKKIAKQTISLAIALAIAVTPLQWLLTGVAHATETGTWVDGDMPQLVLGDQRNDYGNETCTTHTFYYYSYTKPDGSYDSVGRYVPIDVCVKPAAFGYVGDTRTAHYVGFSSTTVYRTILASGNDTFFVSDIPGQDNRFYYAPATLAYGASNMAIFDSFGAAGSFEPYYNELVYKMDWITPGAWLRDSAGNLLAMHARAFSSNGTWMVAESNVGFIRVNTETREITLFDKDIYSYGSGSTPQVTLAISDDGNTVIRSGFGTSNAKVFDLSGCQPAPFVVGSATNTITGCRSRVVQQDLATRVSGFDGLVNLRFTDGGKTVRGVALSRNASGVREYHDMTYSVAGYQPIRLSYLALGDSFSSGEGTYDYVAGTDEPANKCHMSEASYSYLAAHAAGISSSDFHNVACSGAEIENYNEKPQYLTNLSPDMLKTSWLPGIKVQKDFVHQQGPPSVVTLTMGGNDIGFRDKLVRCMLTPYSCFHFKEQRQAMADEIAGKFSNLVDLYKDIKNQSPGVKVYVLGYPQLFDTGNDCGLNVVLDAEEREMSRGLVTYLDAVIRSATQAAGVQYIDVENAFAGHEHCDPGEKAVNGLSDGSDVLGVIGNESYHPNKYGYELLANTLLAQSQNLTKAMPAADSSIVRPPSVGSAAYSAFIGDAPQGGTVNGALYYLGQQDLKITYKGVKLLLKADNLPLKALSSFVVEFHSDPTYAGTITTDANGNLSGEITVPDSLSPGAHTIHILGQDLAGRNVDIYQTVYVAASADDYDGDGIPNSQEKCLAVEPANVDADHDGVDDACDPDIAPDTTPPVVTGAADRQPNAAGWYNGDVTINWGATDPEPSSGAPTQPSATVASQEGTNTYTSDPSCDPLNNCATGSMELKIDKTAPDITYSLSPAPTPSGWNSSAVTVTFGCTDATSGVASCTDPQTVSGADGVYAITGTATDNAGNTSGVNVFVSLDSTKPTVTQAVSPAPNAAGWHNTDVTVTPDCQDNLSGILHCSAPVTLTTEGVDQTVVSDATDNAGNTASATAQVNIDKTAPVLGAPVWSNNPKSLFGTASLTVPATDNLSGIAEAEYFLGDTDPGAGNGATMQVNNGALSVDFGTDFPTGVYKVTVRAKDKAGNWSLPVSDYLVVYDPFGTHMTGQKKLTPSLANGDILPGLISGNQTNQAKFGFNVRYDNTGNIHPQSDFQLRYDTGTSCNKPALAANCHSLDLNATSIAWLTTQDANNSTGIFQGTATLKVDGSVQDVMFRVTGLDGERLDTTTPDHLTVKIFAQGDNPNTATPLYQVSEDVPHGNIHIRTW